MTATKCAVERAKSKIKVMRTSRLRGSYRVSCSSKRLRRSVGRERGEAYRQQVPVERLDVQQRQRCRPSVSGRSVACRSQALSLGDHKRRRYIVVGDCTTTHAWRRQCRPPRHLASPASTANLVCDGDCSTTTV